ncbi:IS110 family transposase [Sphingopyxis sp. EG6]|uniref:IS110 family transposase n=1 Tax=Sphingopyxis sp. EG6 TaxID=1874061 RepID=UPI000DC61DD9|nr:IS110 family transposase [Sphingopyxis sp. EG6]BBB08488.1 transposase IS1111A/IS1328/IS1533 [Sphingopyxis sp. EG6]
MGAMATIGLDLAKSVFQVHGVDADGKVLVRRQLRRGDVLKFFRGLPACLVGIEACATAHHWARAISALGHMVKMMPPAYVKPYVKRGKTDAADAEAICEAVTRPTMRFVAIKTVDQQGALMLHKTRDLLVRQRTMLINGLRGHLAEFGIIAAKGAGGVKAAIEALHEAQEQLPEAARMALHGIVDQLGQLATAIERLEARIVAWHRTNDVSRRLATIPGIGPITASAIAAAVPDGSMFRSGRQFAAWLGLTPKAHSSGGKDRQVGISKQGDGYIRRLLVVGATSVMRLARQDNASRQWAAKLLARKSAKLAAVALANKTARIAWAVMTRGEIYVAPAM